MKQQLVAGILAVSVAGGVGTGVAFNQLGGGKDGDTRTGRVSADPNPSADPSADPTTKPSDGAGGAATPGSGTSTRRSTPPKTTLPLVPLTSMRIIAGAVGPVSVGMSKQAAYATGYFRADVPVPGCDRVDDLVWKTAYQDVLDVQTADNGSVTSIGVRASGPRTRSGLGVGSEYETVRGVLGDVEPVEAGFGQTGLFVQDGSGWIGFLFDAAPGEVTDASPVRFIEVTRGGRPDLVRDGC